MRRPPPRRVAALVLGAAVGIACLYYVASHFQWREVLQILRRADIPLLVLAGGASILVYWGLRALRWFIILRHLGTDVGLLDVYLCTAVSLSLAVYTPFQSGEALKIELLRHHGSLERMPGYSSFVVERAIDLFVVVSAAAVSVLASINLGIDRTVLLALWGGVTLLAVVVAAVVSRVKVRGRSGEFLRHLSVCTNSPGTLFLVTALTLCSWAMVAVGWQICFHCIGLRTSFGNAVAVMSVVTLINVLSLVPGAIGVSEAGIATFLSRLGDPAPLAQAGAVMVRLYGILIVLLGVVHLLIWKVERGRRAGGPGRTAAPSSRPSEGDPQATRQPRAQSGGTGEQPE